MSTPSKSRVFLATPGDLLEEREVFDATVADLNRRFGWQFESLKWEQVLAATGFRPQNLINELVDSCDVFILGMYRRWGQSAPDAPVARSYTEEEFRRAVARLNRTNSPEIFCFFKQIEPALLADPGPELSRVLAFKAEIEQSRQVLYKSFPTSTAFGTLVNEHLAAFAEARLPQLRTPRQTIMLPVLEDLNPREEAEKEAVAVFDQAAYCIREGDVTKASQLLAHVSQVTTDVRLLDAIIEFFSERGETITAQSIEDRRLVLTRDRRLAARRYVATVPAHTTEAIIAASEQQIPVEARADYAEAMREILDSDEYKDQMAADMAEHLTTWELNTLTRFFAGDGKSVMEKMGRFMGDAIPRSVERVQVALAKRGYE